jgi:hypothetical protein
MNEDDMNKFYNIVFAEAAKECDAQQDIMGVAAVLMSIALRLYKTGLHDTDFEKVIDNLVKTADKVKPFLDEHETKSHMLH